MHAVKQYSITSAGKTGCCGPWYKGLLPDEVCCRGYREPYGKLRDGTCNKKAEMRSSALEQRAVSMKDAAEADGSSNHRRNKKWQ